MELGKPSLVSVITSIVLIGVIVWLAYSATQKSNDENYAKGSNHSETTYSPTKNIYPLGIEGCAPMMKVDGTIISPTTKVKK